MGILSYLAGGIAGGLGYGKYKKEQSKDKKAQKEYDKLMKKMSKGKEVKMDALSKEQKKLLKGMSKSALKDIKKLTPLSKVPLASRSDLYGKAKGVLSDLLSKDSAAYQRFKDPYMKQFEKETLPGIAERFAGQGRSSALENVLAGAGADITSQLGQLKTGLMMGAVEPAMSLAELPMKEQLALRSAAMGGAQLPMSVKPYNTVYQPPMIPGAPAQGQGMMQSLLSSALPYAGAAAGTAIGGPLGGAIGSGLGGMFSRSTQTPQSQQPYQDQFNLSQMTGRAMFS